MHRSSVAVAIAIVLSIPLSSGVAFAQSTLSGAPPADEKAMVATPTAPGAVPEIDKPATDGTTASLAAGGQWVTGNSNLLAMTVNGAVDSRRGANEFGAGLLGNYGQSTPPGGQWAVETAANIQGKIRYDRFLSDRAAIFMLVTGRSDKFQGLNFRLNLDPGFKFLFVKAQADALWAEAGYDFQYDDRRTDS
ncbi:MAG TPA: DUF481 domain-containing protein, partial [Polyangiaceae bacterium]|nr:DUF481 domain-containing protein [Polyangiaceae bacterium]